MGTVDHAVIEAAARAMGARTSHDHHLYQRLVEWRALGLEAPSPVMEEPLRLVKIAALLLRHGWFFPCPTPRPGDDEPTPLGSTSDCFALAQSMIRLHRAYHYCEGVTLEGPHVTLTEQAWCVRDDGRTAGTGGTVLSRFGVVFDRAFVLRRHAPLLDQLLVRGV